MAISVLATQGQRFPKAANRPFPGRQADCKQGPVWDQRAAPQGDLVASLQKDGDVSTER